jgi:cytochrome c-type biogenesis protein
VLPAALGLLGFVEPCSIGSSLLFVRHLEGRAPVAKLAETALFAVSRAGLVGLLGVAAVLLGSGFAGLQRGAWVLLGALYVALGLLHATRRGRLPRVELARGRAGSVGLGLLFGLNIPACAGPLLLALLAAAAAGGATGATLARGFVSLGIFGLALSLPLVAAVLSAPARRGLDRLAALSRRAPVWAGGLLVALGLWSIGLGLLAGPAAPR